MNIGFIGAGKVGKALGLFFKNHGLIISGYYSKTSKSAMDAAALTQSKEFTTLDDLAGSSDIIIIAVPDQALKDIDSKITALIHARSIKTRITWLHVSGAHPSHYLTGMTAAGCSVGSMHPLQSFGAPADSADRLNRAWFTLEGTEKAVLAAKIILDQAGAKYSLIDPESKPLYHAGACVISNYLVTLVESGVRYFETAGMNRDAILQAITPLIDATLSNIRDKGTVDALTGPIVRSDFNTVSVHLQALEAQLPAELDLYKAMAYKTVDMQENKRLTHEQADRFRKILEEKRHGG